MHTPFLVRLASFFVFIICSLAQAAEPIQFQFRELLEDRTIRPILDPRVKIYLANDAKPVIVESAKPDFYSGTGISINPFGGSRRHCVEAFYNALNAMIRDAIAGGFDSIVDLRAMIGEQPSEDPHGFTCTPAYKVTVLALHATFGATSQAVGRARNEDNLLLRKPDRSPSEDAIYIPVAAIAGSVDERAILGEKISGYWGIEAPSYRVRGIPEDYDGSAPLSSPPAPQEACRRATLNALKDMVVEADERGFDSLIRIRSHLYDETTPGMASIECEIGKKAVFVRLQGTPAYRQ